jgi:NADPH:quinone reductase-like Zn-dependent oxidoreductase/acyl carrier protein
VSAFAEGDQVIACGARMFDSHVTCDARLARRKPRRLSITEAAGWPSIYMTAYYALAEIARLRRGDTVLVHSAGGGAALAAVQYARHLGATVFATAATEEQHHVLREMGVDVVMDDRTLGWADEVLAHTQGRGVDVVLNSLSGDAVLEGLRVVAPFGRFVEIGAQDVHANGAIALQALRHNVTLSIVALEELARERPEDCGRLLDATLKALEDGVFSPPRVTEFDIGEVEAAFRHMTTGTHLEKVVVRANKNVNVIKPRTANSVVRADGTYVVTGGLGGLGLLTASWLAANGARQLVLVGRRPPDRSTTDAIERLRATGCAVRTYALDIADEGAVHTLFEEIRKELPPLRGVVHAAGVLDDGVVTAQTRARLTATWRAKVDGAYNLARETEGREGLDFVVLFSSTAGVLGNGGQANYAAANTVLDALARTRRSRGEPWVSIAWGAWAEVGMAARLGGAHAFDSSIRPADGLEVLRRVLASGAAHAVVYAGSFRHWKQLNPALARTAMLEHVSSGDDVATTGEWATRLRAAQPDARVALLEQYLREAVSRISRTPVEQLNRATSLKHVGLDSLMMVALKVALERDIGVVLSAALLYAFPTIAKMAVGVAEQVEEMVRTETSTTPTSSVMPVPNRAKPVDADVTTETNEEDADAELLAIFKQIGGSKS